MQIAGIQKTTLVDYPGKVAATIFTRGCSFRCPFCHNPELVIPEQFNPLISEEEILTFLNNRIGKLEAVCITGGEPTIQPEIGEFIRKIKEMGFLVKLDTNGSQPDVLEEIIESGNLDYIAMDIKSSLEKYSMTTGFSSQFFGLGSCLAYGKPRRKAEPRRTVLSNNVISTHSEPTVGWIEEGEKSHHQLLTQNIKKSINLIKDSGIDYEFRTTVCHPLHEVEDFKEIGKLIKGAKRYYIQNFVRSKHIDEHQDFKPFEDEELKKARVTIEKYVGEINIR